MTGTLTDGLLSLKGARKLTSAVRTTAVSAGICSTPSSSLQRCATASHVDLSALEAFMNESDQLMSTEALAEYLGIPTTTIYKWRVQGTAPRGIKIGRHIRYRASEVRRWLDEKERNTAA